MTTTSVPNGSLPPMLVQHGVLWSPDSTAYHMGEHVLHGAMSEEHPGIPLQTPMQSNPVSPPTSTWLLSELSTSLTTTTITAPKTKTTGQSNFQASQDILVEVCADTLMHRVYSLRSGRLIATAGLPRLDFKSPITVDQGMTAEDVSQGVNTNATHHRQDYPRVVLSCSPRVANNFFLYATKDDGIYGVLVTSQPSVSVRTSSLGRISVAGGEKNVSGGLGNLQAMHSHPVLPLVFLVYSSQQVLVWSYEQLYLSLAKSMDTSFGGMDEEDVDDEEGVQDEAEVKASRRASIGKLSTRSRFRKGKAQWLADQARCFPPCVASLDILNSSYFISADKRFHPEHLPRVTDFALSPDGLQAAVVYNQSVLLTFDLRTLYSLSLATQAKSSMPTILHPSAVFIPAEARSTKQDFLWNQIISGVAYHTTAPLLMVVLSRRKLYPRMVSFLASAQSEMEEAASGGGYFLEPATPVVLCLGTTSSLSRETRRQTVPLGSLIPLQPIGAQELIEPGSGESLHTRESSLNLCPFAVHVTPTTGLLCLSFQRVVKRPLSRTSTSSRTIQQAIVFSYRFDSAWIMRNGFNSWQSPLVSRLDLSPERFWFGLSSQSAFATYVRPTQSTNNPIAIDEGLRLNVNGEITLQTSFQCLVRDTSFIDSRTALGKTIVQSRVRSLGLPQLFAIQSQTSDSSVSVSSLSYSLFELDWASHSSANTPSSSNATANEKPAHHVEGLYVTSIPALLTETILSQWSNVNWAKLPESVLLRKTSQLLTGDTQYFPTTITASGFLTNELALRYDPSYNSSLQVPCSLVVVRGILRQERNTAVLCQSATNLAESSVNSIFRALSVPMVLLYRLSADSDYSSSESVSPLALTYRDAAVWTGGVLAENVRAVAIEASGDVLIRLAINPLLGDCLTEVSRVILQGLPPQVIVDQLWSCPRHAAMLMLSVSPSPDSPANLHFIPDVNVFNGKLFTSKTNFVTTIPVTGMDALTATTENSVTVESFALVVGEVVLSVDWNVAAIPHSPSGESLPAFDASVAAGELLGLVVLTNHRVIVFTGGFRPVCHCVYRRGVSNPTALEVSRYSTNLRSGIIGCSKGAVMNGSLQSIHNRMSAVFARLSSRTGGNTIPSVTPDFHSGSAPNDIEATILSETVTSVNWSGRVVLLGCESGAILYLAPFLLDSDESSITLVQRLASHRREILQLQRRFGGSSFSTLLGAADQRRGSLPVGRLLTLPRNTSQSIPGATHLSAVLPDRLLSFSLEYSFKAHQRAHLPHLLSILRPCNPLEALFAGLLASPPRNMLISMGSPTGNTSATSAREKWWQEVLFLFTTYTPPTGTSTPEFIASPNLLRLMSIARYSSSNMKPVTSSWLMTKSSELSHSKNESIDWQNLAVLLTGLPLSSPDSSHAYLSYSAFRSSNFASGRWLASLPRAQILAEQEQWLGAAVSVVHRTSHGLLDLLVSSETYGGILMPRPKSSHWKLLTTIARQMFNRFNSLPVSSSSADQLLASSLIALASKLFDMAGAYDELLETLNRCVSHFNLDGVVGSTSADIIRRAANALVIELKDDFAASRLPSSFLPTLLRYSDNSKYIENAIRQGSLLTATGGCRKPSLCASMESVYALLSSTHFSPPTASSIVDWGHYTRQREIYAGRCRGAIGPVTGAWHKNGVSRSSALSAFDLGTWLGWDLPEELFATASYLETLSGTLGTVGDTSSNSVSSSGLPGIGSTANNEGVDEFFPELPLPSGWVAGIGSGKELDRIVSYLRFSDSYWPGEEGFYSSALPPARAVLTDLSRHDPIGWEIFATDDASRCLSTANTLSAVNAGERHESVKMLCDLICRPAPYMLQAIEKYDSMFASDPGSVTPFCKSSIGTATSYGVRALVNRGSAMDIGMYHCEGGGRSSMTVEFHLLLEGNRALAESTLLTFNDVILLERALLSATVPESKSPDTSVVTDSFLWRVGLNSKGNLYVSFGGMPSSQAVVVETNFNIFTSPTTSSSGGTSEDHWDTSRGDSDEASSIFDAFKHISIIVDGNSSKVTCRLPSSSNPDDAILSYQRPLNVRVLVDGVSVLSTPISVLLPDCTESSISKSQIRLCVDCPLSLRFTEFRLWAALRTDSQLSSSREMVLGLAEKRTRLQMQLKGTRHLFGPFRNLSTLPSPPPEGLVDREELIASLAAKAANTAAAVSSVGSVGLGLSAPRSGLAPAPAISRRVLRGPSSVPDFSPSDSAPQPSETPPAVTLSARQKRMSTRMSAPIVTPRASLPTVTEESHSETVSSFSSTPFDSTTSTLDFGSSFNTSEDWASSSAFPESSTSNVTPVFAAFDDFPVNKEPTFESPTKDSFKDGVDTSITANSSTSTPSVHPSSPIKETLIEESIVISGKWTDLSLETVANSFQRCSPIATPFALISINRDSACILYLPVSNPKSSSLNVSMAKISVVGSDSPTVATGDSLLLSPRSKKSSAQIIAHVSAVDAHMLSFFDATDLNTEKHMVYSNTRRLPFPVVHIVWLTAELLAIASKDAVYTVRPSATTAKPIRFLKLIPSSGERRISDIAVNADRWAFAVSQNYSSTPDVSTFTNWFTERQFCVTLQQTQRGVGVMCGAVAALFRPSSNHIFMTWLIPVGDDSAEWRITVVDLAALLPTASSIDNLDLSNLYNHSSFCEKFADAVLSDFALGPATIYGDNPLPGHLFGPTTLIFSLRDKLLVLTADGQAFLVHSSQFRVLGRVSLGLLSGEISPQPLFANVDLHAATPQLSCLATVSNQEGERVLSAFCFPLSEIAKRIKK